MTVSITVRGRLSERLAAAFEGLVAHDSSHAATLVGTVAAQAQLHGLLGRIRDLELEPESVTVAGPGDAGDRPLPWGVSPSGRAESDRD